MSELIARHDPSVTFTQLAADARTIGVHASLPTFGASYCGDLSIHGDTGKVRKMLAVMGMGIEGEPRGPYQQQDVRDATGRLWGTLGGSEGRSHVRLCYLMART